jgi:hypothetical protein
MLTLGETGTQQTRNLLDQGFGSQESIVLLGELLDELLVLVEPEDRRSARALKDSSISTYFFKSSTVMYSRSICLA